MKYSVVIPTYNNENNLLSLLASLDTQEYSRTEYEVIVVDDGSDIDISTIFNNKNFSFGLSILRIARDSRSCRAKARNFGWKNSYGSYVVFLDSDTVVGKNYLAELDRYSGLADHCLIIGTRIHVRDRIEVEDIYTDKLGRFFDVKKDDFSSLEFRYLVFSSSSFNIFSVEHSWVHAYSCNMCVSRINLEKTNGFDENFIEWGGEDIELAYRLYKLGVEPAINKDLEVLHQLGGTRDDISISEKKLEGYKRNIDYLIVKHPQILNKSVQEIHSYLNGGMKFDQGLESFGSDVSSVECRSNNDIGSIMDRIEYCIDHSIELFVLDYLEASGLDLFIQSFRAKSKKIKYFPMNKVANVKKMNLFYGLADATSNLIL